ncbi:MAG TPA: MFS transporter [Prolixibacteraceae bacterium]|nr:MFS transporter [Prolixibacteraceae bacterium]
MNKTNNQEGYLFSKRYTTGVFILLFLLYMFDYIDRVVVTSMFTMIERDLGITHTKSGLLVSAVYWSIVLLTLPVSILVDRWSRSKTIGIMAILWSIATALCALTGNFMQLFFTRMLIGVGEAGYAPGGTAMISGMYPQHKRARMMGLWNASIPMGTAIGIFLGGIIATHWGWRHAFGLVALPGLIVAVAFLFIKDYKTIDLSYSDTANHKVKMGIKEIFNQFITKPSLIFTYFGMAAVVFVTTSLITWLSTYFEVTRGLVPGKAGMLASSVMGLAIVGAPVGGYLADRWRKTNVRARLLFPTFSTFIAAIFLFSALFLFKGTIQYVLFLCMGVMVTMFVSAASAVTQDVIHAGLRAMSYAIAVVIQNLLGASMAPIVIGKIYDHSDISTALSILPGILVVASLLFYLGSRHYESDLKKVPDIHLEPDTK